MNIVLTPDQKQAIESAISAGLSSLHRPEPMRLSEWAAEHFYLSPESSYIAGRWEAYPYQTAIMDCISNDDIREIDFIKSARVGYTKIILAAMGYFAEHKRRNQAVWQPVDDDADEFSKTELDPAIRDIPAWRAIFPHYDKRNKYNTMDQKAFAGSTLHIKGGKAAKNYRRISVDVAYLDELDGFDSDIEKEGDPVTLASKRIEGATFKKLVIGSTPKTKGDSLIEFRVDEAEHVFRFAVPCKHCGQRHLLTWGGKDAPDGIKWVGDKPETAAHLCSECGALSTQADYLDNWESGRWESSTGTWIDSDCFFRNSAGGIVDAPQHIAFHLWTAYSPMTSWSQIVREFLAAVKSRTKLKTFVNTTLGETWEEDDSEQADEDELYARREPWAAAVPDWVLVLTAGIDTQDDRFELQVDGWGAGEERATIDYVRLFGDPSRNEIWDKLAEAMRRTYQKADGTMLDIRLACQDHGGHYGDEVNKFSKRMGLRRLIPVKGASTYANPIASVPRKRNAKGTYLTIVGTDTAKELLFHRMTIREPGPGYWHWPIKQCFDETYFKQLTAEERIKKWVRGVPRFVWDAKGRRQEPWDCSVYSLSAIRILQQHFGLRLEMQPRPADQTNARPARPSHPKATGGPGSWL